MSDLNSHETNGAVDGFRGGRPLSRRGAFRLLGGAALALPAAALAPALPALADPDAPTVDAADAAEDPTLARVVAAYHRIGEERRALVADLMEALARVYEDQRAHPEKYRDPEPEARLAYFWRTRHNYVSVTLPRLTPRERRRVRRWAATRPEGHVWLADTRSHRRDGGHDYLTVDMSKNPHALGTDFAYVAREIVPHVRECLIDARQASEPFLPASYVLSCFHSGGAPRE